MCYSIIVGRKASATGKVILAANDDWPGCPGHVLYEASHDYKKTDRFQLVEGKDIPQAAHTCSYVHSAAAYDTGWRTESWNEGVNEKNVSVSMDGIYAFRYIESQGGLQADDLPLLILERASTAREAVLLVGELIKTYGFCVSSIEGAAGAVVLAVADPVEGYFMEVLPGGVWAAKKVGDTEVEVRPNCLGIQEIDFEDKENYLYSENMVSIAMEKGWYQEGEKFNFSEIFSSDEAICAYGGPKDDVNTYRRWNGLFRLAGADTKLDEQKYAAEADAGSVTIQMVKGLLGDSMKDTKYDLAKNPQAGVHHNPYYMDINLSVGQAGTVVAMVIDYACLEYGYGALAWFSLGNAGISPFIPCFEKSQGLPEMYQVGVWGMFSETSAWFLMEELCELVYRRYDEVIPLVKKKTAAWEKEFQNRLRASIVDSEGKENIKYVTDSYGEWIAEQVKLLVTYLKGHCLGNSYFNTL